MIRFTSFSGLKSFWDNQPRTRATSAEPRGSSGSALRAVSRRPRPVPRATRAGGARAIRGHLLLLSRKPLAGLRIRGSGTTLGGRRRFRAKRFGAHSDALRI